MRSEPLGVPGNPVPGGSPNNQVEMWNVAEDWQHEAACRGQDAVYFFAPNYFERRAEKNAREAVAKSFCARCPVREECLEYALATREGHGIWGGLNEMERRATAARARPRRELTSGEAREAVVGSPSITMPCEDARMDDQQILDRIAELGLELPPPPKPVASYIPVRVAGGLAYVGGTGPDDRRGRRASGPPRRPPTRG